MSAWPPPPDLASIKELVRDADIEGFIADGSPADEYDHEAEQLQRAIVSLPTSQLTIAHVLPLLEPIWSASFSLSDDELSSRRPGLTSLARQIARFFGPEAQPQTRNQGPAQ